MSAFCKGAQNLTIANVLIIISFIVSCVPYILNLALATVCKFITSPPKVEILKPGAHRVLKCEHLREFTLNHDVCGLAEIQQLLQNRAARIITGSNCDAPSKPLIKDLGWQTIEDHIQYELQIIVCKSRKRLAPQYLYNVFVDNSSDSLYNLRNTATDLKLPKKTSSNGQKGLSYKGAKMWNSLPTESKLEPSLASFKKSSVHMT